MIIIFWRYFAKQKHFLWCWMFSFGKFGGLRVWLFFRLYMFACVDCLSRIFFRKVELIINIFKYANFPKLSRLLFFHCCTTFSSALRYKEKKFKFTFMFGSWNLDLGFIIRRLEYIEIILKILMIYINLHNHIVVGWDQRSIRKRT